MHPPGARALRSHQVAFDSPFRIVLSWPPAPLRLRSLRAPPLVGGFPTPVSFTAGSRHARSVLDGPSSIPSPSVTGLRRRPSCTKELPTRVWETWKGDAVSGVTHGIRPGTATNPPGRSRAAVPFTRRQPVTSATGRTDKSGGDRSRRVQPDWIDGPPPCLTPVWGRGSGLGRRAVELAWDT